MLALRRQEKGDRRDLQSQSMKSSKSHAKGDVEWSVGQSTRNSIFDCEEADTATGEQVKPEVGLSSGWHREYGTQNSSKTESASKTSS